MEIVVIVSPVKPEWITMPRQGNNNEVCIKISNNGRMDELVNKVPFSMKYDITTTKYNQ